MCGCNEPQSSESKPRQSGEASYEMNCVSSPASSPTGSPNTGSLAGYDNMITADFSCNTFPVQSITRFHLIYVLHTKNRDHYYQIELIVLRGGGVYCRVRRNLNDRPAVVYFLQDMIP